MDSSFLYPNSFSFEFNLYQINKFSQEKQSAVTVRLQMLEISSFFHQKGSEVAATG